MTAMACVGEAPAATRLRLLPKLLAAFGTVAALSALIGLGGRLAGHSIALAGYTDDPTPREVVIGNNVLTAPSNMIRQQHARRDGIAARLDLYLRWPQMDGFSEAARDDFNNAGATRRILFLTFEPKMMSRDMSGRFGPIYSDLIAKPGRAGPAGVTFYDFTAKSGYVDETLAVAERPDGQELFVARCLSGPSAAESLAPCERDIQLGDELSLTYRFPQDLLRDWPVLDPAIRREAARLLKTSN